MNSAEALIDLAVGGAGLAWVCDFMMAGGRRPGSSSRCSAIRVCGSAIHTLSLQSRNVLPKVRAFVDFVAAELARSGVET